MSECPTCGEDKFSCEQSMKSHHKQVHGESIAGLPVSCANCGYEKRVLPTHKQSCDRHFCDEECRGVWREENWTGEDCPLNKLNRTYCHNCNDELKVSDWRMKRSDKHFCGRKCQSKWQEESGVNSGSNSPNWAGGTPDYYGKSWFKQRRKARERDENCCRICGSGKEEMGQKPDVHHIKPVKSFDNIEDAHYLNNLVSLCRQHHAEMENLNEEKQRERLK